MRLIDIDQAAQACKQTNADWAFRKLQDHCHRLAGIAASFGFAELGNRARLIDIGISQFLEAGDSVDCKRQVLADAEDLMNEIEAVLPEQQYHLPKTENDTYYG